MSPKDRRRSDQLHFAGSSNRFDNKRNSVPVIDQNPISKTFTRKIIYCKRCRNRVVSNVNHCPYCGKNLLPIYRRLWVWLVLLFLVAAAAVVVFVFWMPSISPSSTISREEIKPIVIGAPDNTQAKNLKIGTTVDCNGLLVTVTDINMDLVSSNATAITTVRVQFVNKRTEKISLYKTQWSLEAANGSRVNSGPIVKQDGEVINSGLDSNVLEANEAYSVDLYFDIAEPKTIIFAPDVLLDVEESLVTWLPE